MQRTMKRLTLILDKTPENHEDSLHIRGVLENIQHNFNSCRHLAIGSAAEMELSDFASRFFWSRQGSEVVSVFLYKQLLVLLGLLIGTAGRRC